MVPPFSRELALDIGRAIRDVRLAYGWTQRHLAGRAGSSQSVVCRVEAGSLPSFDLLVVGRMLEVLGISVGLTIERPLAATGRRQRDAGHARCLGYVARRLILAGYEVATEVEIGDGRWRSWIDILAFHATTGLLLVIEVKTELHDVGAEQRRFATYERASWPAARRLGWAPATRIGALLLLRTDQTDARVSANRDLLRASFPGRADDLQRWIADPIVAPRNGRALAAIDPASRRRAWLLEAGRDGRRTSARYRDYADFVRGID